MRPRIKFRTIFWLTTLVVILVGPSRGHADDRCHDILTSHGFLSRAAFSCGFKRYSTQMIAAARTCAKQYSQDTDKLLMKHGMDEFDQRETDEGHDALCAKILSGSPQIVGR